MADDRSTSSVMSLEMPDVDDDADECIDDVEDLIPFLFAYIFNGN